MPCEFCKTEMGTSNGCVCNKITHSGIEYDPIRVGDPGDYYEDKPGERCSDCTALYGYYHHPGCDAERCPICKDQLISCDCLDTDEEDKCEDEFKDQNLSEQNAKLKDLLMASLKEFPLTGAAIIIISNTEDGFKISSEPLQGDNAENRASTVEIDDDLKYLLDGFGHA